jgi:hypothetical protein
LGLSPSWFLWLALQALEEFSSRRPFGKNPGWFQSCICFYSFTTKMVTPLSEAFYDGGMRGGVPGVGLSELFVWPEGVNPHDIMVVDVPGSVALSLTKSKGNMPQAEAASMFARYFHLVCQVIHQGLMF